MVIVVASVVSWIVLGGLAALATAAAAERLGLPGWLGAVCGFLFPVVGLAAVVVLVVVPDVPERGTAASAGDHPVLQALAEHAPASADEVAGRCFFTIERTRNQLQFLAARHLVATDIDGRFVLTAEGRRLMSRAAEADGRSGTV